LSKVLVAFDGSESSEKAVAHAAEMVLKDPTTEVTVLLVVHIYNLDSFEASLDIKDRFIESLIESGKSTLAKAKKIFDGKNVPVATVIEEGDPASAIINYVHKKGIDLIIMGTRGLTSLKGMVLGSVSQKVIHLSDKPVMLIK
jgi:nucleotide-binding universal stress UspA family protein